MHVNRRSRKPSSAMLGSASFSKAPVSSPAHAPRCDSLTGGLQVNPCVLMASLNLGFPCWALPLGLLIEGLILIFRFKPKLFPAPHWPM